MHVQNKKYRNFVSISRLTGKCAAQKFKNFWSFSLWTCLHHMVIFKSQNKITDFWMILAWASPFNLHIACINPGNQRVCFQIGIIINVLAWNCTREFHGLSQLFPLHLSTYVTGLRPFLIFYSWCAGTVFRRQNQTCMAVLQIYDNVF